MTQLSLEIVEGPGLGRVFPVEGDVEIGRDAAAGVWLNDPHVDPLHARVTASGDGALVEDLGERGGTFVNDAEVAAPTRINLGDEIQVGTTVLKLTAGEPSTPRPAPKPFSTGQAQPQFVPAGVLAQPRDAEAVAPPEESEMDDLLDVRVKSKARHAPLAVAVIVIYAVLIYLATARFSL